MDAKIPRAPAKAKAKKTCPLPADPKGRLKPISLHGMVLDDVLRKLVSRGRLLRQK